MDGWVDVATIRGLARAHVDYPVGTPRLLLVLGHGAGGTVGAADLLAVRDAAVRTGVAVVRVEQPYRVAGRGAPPPAAHLDQAWVEMVAALRDRGGYGGLPLVVGGRSSGARVACRTASAVGASAVLALAFPLRAPRTGRWRGEELRDAGVPVLVVNGDRDPFGVPDAGGDVAVRVVAGENHALSKDPAAVATIAVRWLKNWLEERRGDAALTPDGPRCDSG